MKAISSTVNGGAIGTTIALGATAYPSTPFQITVTGLTSGKVYYWLKGSSADVNCICSTTTLTSSCYFEAAATTATLTGASATTITATLTEMLLLHAATVTPTLPARQVTVGQYTSANLNWSRQIQLSDEYVFVKRSTYAVAISLADIVNMALTQELNFTWTPPVILTQPVATSVAAAAQATLTTNAGSEYTVTYTWRELSEVSTDDATLTWGSGITALTYSSTTRDGTATLTSNNTNVTDGKKVTIGEKVYTFKDTLGTTEGNVHIGANADASLTNLIAAINHTGTAFPSNTDYYCAAANATVTAGTLSAHAFTVTNKALTTVGIYDVATAKTLKVTPTSTTTSGTNYYSIATDNAASPGSIATDRVALTVT